MRFKYWQRPVIPDGQLTKYNWMVQHPDKMKLGMYTDIGAFTYINARNGITIDDFVQIGSHCAIYSISTIDGAQGPVHLHYNCRIGSHTVILPNVSIGENTIIGANSLVNKDIPENVIAFGTPAKVIRNLTMEEIKKMEEEIMPGD
jgi:acetyltransferase-like isoleucine patch superfamily enzyme